MMNLHRYFEQNIPDYLDDNNPIWEPLKECREVSAIELIQNEVGYVLVPIMMSKLKGSGMYVGKLLFDSGKPITVLEELSEVFLDKSLKDQVEFMSEEGIEFPEGADALMIAIIQYIAVRTYYSKKIDEDYFKMLCTYFVFKLFKRPAVDV